MSQHDGSRVFYFTRMLAEYRIPILERLNERLDGRLIVFSGNPPDGTSTLLAKSVGDFEHHPLPNYWFRGETFHAQPYGSAFDTYGNPAVVLAEESPRSVTLPFLLRRARLAGAGRVLWGIFYSVFRPFSITHPLQRYRIEMARRVEACACYTRGVRDQLAPHVDPNKLFVAQNTMDTNRLFALRRELERKGKQTVRRELGIPEGRATLVFTGQLIPRKGTNELLDTFAALRRERPATLLVMGGGPEREAMEARVRNEALEGVFFLGSISQIDKSAPYLYASDAMLLPGYVGLVANHAFSMGLPLVTQKAPDGIPFHGPEVESVISGYNGFVTDRDPAALLNAVRHVLDHQQQYSRHAIRYVEENLTIDRMVDAIVDAVHYAAANRPSR